MSRPDGDEPSPVDPDEPSPVDPDEPSPVDPDEPTSTDPDEAEPDEAEPVGTELVTVGTAGTDLVRTTEEGAGTGRRPLVVGAAVVAALAVGAVVWAVVAGAGGEVAATASPTPSGSASSTAPSVSPSGPDASGAPVPDPTAGDPEESPEESPASEPGEDDAGQAFVPTTEDAVDLDETATFDSGATARLSRLVAVQGEAEGPGEVAGPAVQVTVEVTNGTGAAIDLGTSVVNVYGGADHVPGEPLSGPGVDVLEGTLAPGASATGTYVFGLAADLRDPLQVTVSHDPTVTTVLFEGAGPTG